MSNGFGGLDGEAESFGDRVGPLRPGYEAVGAIEGGVDFSAGEGLNITLEVSSLLRELVGVLPGNAPTGSADADEGHG